MNARLMRNEVARAGRGIIPQSNGPNAPEIMKQPGCSAQNFAAWNSLREIPNHRADAV